MRQSAMSESQGGELSRIRCVLVETTHTGNLGAAARAMKTMGLARLALVNPKSPPDAEALARASGADDLLARATIHPDLVSALAGCRLVIGASARLRSLEEYRPVLTANHMKVIDLLPVYYLANRTFIPVIGPWVINRLKLGKFFYNLDNRLRRRKLSNGTGLKTLLARKETGAG